MSAPKPIPSPQATRLAKAGRGLLLAVALTALTACGGAPVVSPELMPKSRLSASELSAMSSDALQAKRDELASQRKAASERHAQAERSCWQQFTVNRCIDQSARERRALHDQLRADDIAVEDEQRKRKLQRANERLDLKKVNENKD